MFTPPGDAWYALPVLMKSVLTFSTLSLKLLRAALPMYCNVGCGSTTMGLISPQWPGKHVFQQQAAQSNDENLPSASADCRRDLGGSKACCLDSSEMMTTRTNKLSELFLRTHFHMSRTATPANLAPFRMHERPRESRFES